MRTTFRRFDAVLIDRVFQPVCNALAGWAGMERQRLAALCLDAASVAWIVSQAGALSHAVAQWQPGLALPRLLLLLLGLAALSSLRVAFQRVGAKDGPNPLRPAMLPHRGMALALLAVRLTAPSGLAGAADVVMLICAVCALYLGACASPPARRRGRRVALSEV